MIHPWEAGGDFIRGHFRGGYIVRVETNPNRSE